MRTSRFSSMRYNRLHAPIAFLSDRKRHEIMPTSWKKALSAGPEDFFARHKLASGCPRQVLDRPLQILAKRLGSANVHPQAPEPGVDSTTALWLDPGARASLCATQMTWASRLHISQIPCRRRAGKLKWHSGHGIGLFTWQSGALLCAVSQQLRNVDLRHSIDKAYSSNTIVILAPIASSRRDESFVRGAAAQLQSFPGGEDHRTESNTLQIFRPVTTVR
ncbi:hypothetical protein EJ02DRAFT_54017 [Clathrospora elynae]|uniref:Uncharacterized protein n=1 Tax=Clathrospora elynae TaxID=706981 RepID=A0A6A5T3Q8_9PLEO|nr:hypothetical protein EJ02DRAFT_54017 [Clathrospora elynae]